MVNILTWLKEHTVKESHPYKKSAAADKTPPKEKSKEDWRFPKSKERQEKYVDEQGDESFPASDPPANY